MLQRIQSFYLVLAVVAIALMFRFPIATYTTTTPTGDINAALQITNTKTVLSEDMQDYRFIGDDTVNMPGKWILGVLAGIAGAIVLVSIFLFKNRMLQIRVIAFAFLFNVALIFLIFFWAINGTGGNGGYLKALTDTGLMPGDITTNMLTPSTIAPIVSVILLFLAQRAIRKDEIKVRAADRLR